MQGTSKKDIYLYGKNPLKEALFSYARTGSMPIEELFLTKSAEANSEIMSLVQKNKLPYSIVTFAQIENLVGKDAVHQGILARLSEKMLYASLDSVLAAVSSKERPLFVLLDELQDPHNVGAIVRSSVAFGADAILVPEHGQTQITGTVIKSSAGTTFCIPIVRIGNINTTLLKLQEKHFWIYGLTKGGDTSLTKVVFDSPTVIVIGSEGEGIPAKTLDICDFKLSIPISETCESLNASNAAAVTLYEWKKQNSV
jgi:23S rRNA (guanosine2251-2'-O)-methyltransferase